MKKGISLVIMVVMTFILVIAVGANVNPIYGVLEMLIELEASGNDEFTIESMEVNETANDEGIFVLCNYVSGCEYEWQDDAEIRPNTLTNDFVLEGTLHLIHKDLDTGNDEIEVLDLRSNLNPIVISQQEDDEGVPVTQYSIIGDLEISGGGLTGLMNLGERTVLARMNVTDDGDGELLVKAF